MKSVFAMIVAAFMALPFSSAHAETKDIVDTAAGAGKFETLITAAKAAGLVETLKGAGPFTVFAPTDDAFAKLPKGTVEDLLKPENKEKLAAILTYHVVPGKVMAADIKGKKTNVKTVQGGELAVDATNGVKINDATVVTADVAASNGVIHIIDTVVMPKM
jgi:uncharacterized surface protein with fasciclin (FAS1) repeats